MSYSGNIAADHVEATYNRRYVLCPSCLGDGCEHVRHVWGVEEYFVDEPCVRCDGLGEIPADEVEEVEA